MDPDNGQEYTLAQMKVRHKGEFSEHDIEVYWKDVMDLRGTEPEGPEVEVRVDPDAATGGREGGYQRLDVGLIRHVGGAEGQIHALGRQQRRHLRGNAPSASGS